MSVCEEWAFAGRGTARLVEAHGARRVDGLRALGAAAFSSLVERRDPAVAEAPAARLFGGLSFRAGETRSGPWEGFADASFTLPRWLHAVRGERAALRFSFDGAELGRPEALVAEVAQVRAALERAPLGREAPREPPGPAPQLDEQDERSWGALVEAALAGIHAGALRKVVAARQSHLRASAPFELGVALARLGRLQGGAARFAFERGERVFLGATPERLAVLRGTRLVADALAGSLRRSGRDDAREAAALLASDKDLREHAHVVAGIRAALGPLCASLQSAPAPSVSTLPLVHHLHTQVTAQLSRPTHVLEIVQALHPTPAVCGLPRETALDWIAAHEPAARGWYAAPVGWFDAEGDGAFAVAIRSAVVRGREAWLFAGAGIVDGSQPAQEYRETAVKQGTMLAALGVSP